jgi:catechol 2,3-dioxygenase-like lactoylglutathione lyase family enzyme
MPLKRIEHYLVLTDDIDKTRDFYRDGLGLVVGFRPELEFPGYWLYAGDIPCIHIADWESYRVWTAAVGIPVSSRAAGTGPLDHVAFNATGFETMRERLHSQNIEVSENLLDEIGLRQLFVKDPNGLTIELNFRERAA